MRISDWSSDVCSSDLFFGIESGPYLAAGYDEIAKLQEFSRPVYEEIAKKRNQKILYIVPWPGQAVYSKNPIDAVADLKGFRIQIGRASCRARVCQYV